MLEVYLLEVTRVTVATVLQAQNARSHEPGVSVMGRRRKWRE